MRAAIVSAALLLLAAPALAQTGPGTTGNTDMGPGQFGQPNSSGRFTPAGVPRKDPTEDEDRPHGDDDKQAPPPAIPGATPGDSAAAPAERTAAEMSPNDALFDAISRGDLAGAKDALNRGAQLEAHNMLGQTPLDASIDLDRNDITFLLLSMRTPAQIAGAARPPAATATAAATERGKPGRHGRKSVVEASASAAAVQKAEPGTNRGQPNPGAGFIGF